MRMPLTVDDRDRDIHQTQARLCASVGRNLNILLLKVCFVDLLHSADQQHAKDDELREALDCVEHRLDKWLGPIESREEEERDEAGQHGLCHRSSAIQPDQSRKNQLTGELDQLPVKVFVLIPTNDEVEELPWLWLKLLVIVS